MEDLESSFNAVSNDFGSFLWPPIKASQGCSPKPQTMLVDSIVFVPLVGQVLLFKQC